MDMILKMLPPSQSEEMILWFEGNNNTFMFELMFTCKIIKRNLLNL